MMFRDSRKLVICVAITLSLVACGGGGGGGSSSVTGPSYTGSTSPTAISQTNAETVETSASDASAQAISAEAAMSANPLGIVSNSDSFVPTSDLIMLTVDSARQAILQGQTQNIPTGITFTSSQLNQQMQTSEFCGGSVSIPDNTNYNSSTIDITMTFNELCRNDGISPEVIMNGMLRLIQSDTSFSVIYSNFTMSIDGAIYTMNASVTCDSTGSSCAVDFVGSDGKTYRIVDLNVGGNDTSGYYVSGTFYHPDYGSVSMSTITPVTYGCAPAPQPDTGEMSFVGQGSTSGRIIFQGCSDYSYCYNEGSGEVCNSGTW